MFLSDDAFSHSQQLTVQFLAFGVSCLSLLGSCSIALSYALFPALRRLSFKLVFWMSIADIGANLAFIVTTPGIVYADSAISCRMQGFMLTFFHLASVLWTTVRIFCASMRTTGLRMISYTLYQSVIRRRVTLRATADYWDKQLHLFHAICWGLPLGAGIAALAIGIGDTGGLCWIKADGETLSDAGSAGRFFLFYIPLWLMILFNAIVYVGVMRELQLLVQAAPQSDDTYKAQMVTLTQKLKYYPVILVFCWIWGTINRIDNFIHPHKLMFWLVCVQVSAQQLQGFFNSIAYGMTPAVQSEWKQWWSGYQATGDAGNLQQQAQPSYPSSTLPSESHNSKTKLLSTSGAHSDSFNDIHIVA